MIKPFIKNTVIFVDIVYKPNIYARECNGPCCCEGEEILSGLSFLSNKSFLSVKASRTSCSLSFRKRRDLSFIISLSHAILDLSVLRLW